MLSLAKSRKAGRKLIWVLIVGLAVVTGCAEIPKPVPSQWGIRLLYFKNDTRGRYMAQRMMAWLKEHNVTNVFTRQEYIGETDQICVYAGPYTSRQEAEKDLPTLRAKNNAFRGCDVKGFK